MSAERALDTSWMADALCRQIGGDFWYTEKTEPGYIERINIAKRVCNMCPVKDACLTHALETGEPHGIWGGWGPAQRRQLGQKPRQRPFPHGTPAGYRRHFREGIPMCEACRRADWVRREAGRCGG